MKDFPYIWYFIACFSICFSTNSEPLSLIQIASNTILDDNDSLCYLQVSKATIVSKAIGTECDLTWYPTNSSIAGWVSCGLKWCRSDWNYSVCQNVSDQALQVHNNFSAFLPNNIVPYINFTSFRGYDNNQFATFCGTVVTEFHNEVKYWEIGNEPHNSGFSGDWVAFANYFNSAATRIKSIDPTAKILSPGDDGIWGGAGMTDYLPLIKSNVDILAIHPYVGQGLYDDPTPEGPNGDRLKPFVDLAKQNNISDIWITEYGWTLDTNTGEGARRTTPVGLAKYLSRGLFHYSLKWGIKVIGQYNWGRGDGYDMSHHTQALTAYNSIISILDGANDDVSTLPFNNTSFEVSRVNGYSSSKIERYLLVKNSNKIFIVFWLRIPQQDSFQKQNVNIVLNFRNSLSVNAINAYDILLSSVGSPLNFNQSGKAVVIKNALISDYPNIIELSLQ